VRLLTYYKVSKEFSCMQHNDSFPSGSRPDADEIQVDSALFNCFQHGTEELDDLMRELADVKQVKEQLF